MDSKDNYGEEKASEGKSEARHDTLTNNELLQKVQEFFYTNDTLLMHFENYVTDNAHHINLDSDEYSLKYTELYNNYKAMFESSIEDFIVSLGKTPLDFYHALKEATDEDPDSNDAIFGQIMFAISDFDIFMTMMREGAQSQHNARK